MATLNLAKGRIAMQVKQSKNCLNSTRLNKHQITVTKYGYRYWAVYIGEELLAVTVYKKGAMAIKDYFNFFADNLNNRTDPTKTKPTIQM